MSRTPALLRTALIAVVAAALGAVGCAGKPGTLSGTVTYRGKALKGGSVSFYEVGGNGVAVAPIQPDGTYKAENIRAGKYKICVETDSMRTTLMTGAMAMKGGGGKEKNVPPPGANVPEGYKMSSPPASQMKDLQSRYVPLPPQYTDKEQTPLTVEVTGGEQQHPITLD